MTYQIALSAVKDHRQEFENSVAEHVDRLNAFTKQVGKPRPTAHPLVEEAIKCIRRPNLADKYEADYVIVDDTPPPPPPPTLVEKREDVARRLHLAEAEAKEKLLPKRQARLATVKFQMASLVPEDKRTKEENEIIVGQQDLSKKWLAIELISATAEAAIDDLSEEALDNWQPPSFE